MKGLWLALVLIPGSPRAMTFLTSDADATIVLDDVAPSINALTLDLYAQIRLGDFDGDGRADIAVAVLSTGGWDVSLISGRDLPRQGLASHLRGLRVRPPLQNYWNTLRWGFADVDGDGRRDLILHQNLFYESGAPIVFGVRGTPFNGRSVDLGAGQADFTVGLASQSFSFAAGDIDGDGKEDLAFGTPGPSGGREKTVVVWGKAPMTGTVDPFDGVSGAVLLGPLGAGPGQPYQFGQYVAIADVDGNGKKDLLVSAPNMTAPGANPHNGVTFGFLGAVGWPPVWDLAVASESFRINGSTDVGPAFLSLTGDVDGDGRADIALNRFSRLTWLRGSDIVPGGVSTVTPWSPSDPLTGTGLPQAVGDFDGDGRADYFTLSNPVDHLDGWLSEDGSIAAPGLPSFTVEGPPRTVALGDIDGDGRDDLVWTRFALDADGNQRLVLAVIYGFHPLRHPFLSLLSRSQAGSRLTLALGSEGAPAEMRLTGDIADETRGRWSPYASPKTLILTSPDGTKTITAQFRNSRGRESGPVSLVLGLASGGGDITTHRNGVRPGVPAEWEVPTEGGAFCATVYDTEGRRVRILDIGERPAGVYTVRWDGFNVAGHRVAPGIYVLVVEINGTFHRQRVWVR